MTWTWNSADKSTGIDLSNGDLTATRNASGAWASARGTNAIPSGKYYFEVEYQQASGGGALVVGLMTSAGNLDSFVGSDAYGIGFFNISGDLTYGGSQYSYGSGSYVVNDIIGVAVDADTGKVWFAVNNVWQASGDPANGTNEAYTLAGSLFPALSIYYNTDYDTARFTSGDQTYSPPTGFLAAGDPILVLYFEGYVYELGSPVSRQLFLHARDTGELMGETTSSGNGYYYLTSTSSGTHYLVCLDDAAGVDYNDLIIGNIQPTGGF